MNEKEIRKYEAFVMTDVILKYQELFQEKSLLAYAKTQDILRYSAQERAEAGAELALLTKLMEVLLEVTDKCVDEVKS